MCSPSCTLCAQEGIPCGEAAVGKVISDALGVRLNPTMTSSTFFSLCASCSTRLREVVELKEELARKTGALRSLVSNSISSASGRWSNFDPVTAQLRAEIVGGLGFGAYQTSLHQLEEGRRSPGFQRSSTFQQSDQQLHQSFVPETDCLSESESPLNSQENNTEQDSDYVPPAPSKSKKGGGRPGKMSETQKSSFLSKKMVAEIEQFSPVVTTSDGRRFYDDYEILTLPTGTLQCATCGWKENNDGKRPWLRIRSIKVHIKGFHQNAYSCSACNASFTSFKLLQKHECGRKNRGTHRCDGCQKLFTFANNLYAHKKSQNCGNPIQTSSSSPCTICGRPLKNPDYLKQHLWTHCNAEEKALGLESGELQPKKECQCPTCGKLVSKAYFAYHLDLHRDVEEDKKIICGVEGCGLAFPNKKFLASHVKDKHPKKARIPVSCPDPECKGKTFVSQKALLVHTRRRHADQKEKTLSCPICNARTALSKDLKQHIRAHESRGQNAEMFTVLCPVEGCGQKTLSSQALKLHMKSKHPETTEAVAWDNELSDDPEMQGENNGRRKSLRRSTRKLQKKTSCKTAKEEELPDFIKLEDGGGWKLEFLGFTVFRRNDGYTCESCGLEFNCDLDDSLSLQDHETETELRKLARDIKIHIKDLHRREDYKS